MNFNLYDRSTSSKSFKRKAFFSPNKDPLPALLLPDKFSFPSFKFSLPDSRKITQINSPDNSQYNIKTLFPDRPETSNLSGLTLRENEKFSMISSSVMSHSVPRLMLAINQTLKLPTEQDFEKILNKLELISSNKNTGHRRIILIDAEPCQILLEKGNIQYFTIRCLNKKPPLLITVKKKRGAATAYLSRITPEPNKMTCDFYFSKEMHYVNDVGHKFKNENFYLAIEALADCDCMILIGFGKRPPKKKQIFLIEDIVEDDSSFFQYAQTDRSKKPEEIKDFIKINKSSFKLRGSLQSRQGDWERRRELVIENKSKNIEMKKQKTIFKIHKHEIKREEEKKKREQVQKTNAVQNMQKMWLTVAFFVKSIEYIKTMLNSGRSTKLAKIRQSFTVTRIQKLYRNSLGISPEIVNLTRAATLLKFFSCSLKPFINTQLIKCIKESSENFILPKAFAKLIKQINLAKELWRDHMRRVKMATEALIRQWNSVIEERLVKLSRSNTKRKKTQDTGKIALIPVSVRSQVITDYILDCKKKYLRDVCEYRENKRRLLDKVLARFRDVNEYHRVHNRAPPRRSTNAVGLKSDYPTLNLIPTNAQMLKLIEKASQSLN